MTLWFAALMGLVEGLTEFLPVSSTAHLRMVPALVGVPDPGAAFSAVIQVGALGAVIAYFIPDLVRMARALFKDRGSPDARLAYAIVVGTIPIGILGLLLKRYVTGSFRSLWVVAIALIVVGAIMAVADRAAKHERALPQLGLVDALVIGVAQACALVPGVSRSGATIVAALALGFRRDDAARFSFLLSVPAIAAAGVFELKDALHEIRGPVPLALATAVAFVSGYASIAWMLRFLRTRTLLGFSIYRILVGAALLVLLVTGLTAP
ncbi:MAG TPA: undecaprenyl-diphosphatase UppP [Haliangiales bacterium]|nr:undecaprenyl-diphosphatase UppP [Haliangiales bacterium]